MTATPTILSQTNEARSHRRLTLSDKAVTASVSPQEPRENELIVPVAHINIRLLAGWAACTLLLVAGLSRPIIQISVNVEAVLKDAIDHQPIVGLLLQEKGFKLSDIASKLPPTSTTTQSILSSVAKLYRIGSFSAATLILLFSVFTPIVKQFVYLRVIVSGSEKRFRYLHWTKLLHKWAMVDVFVLSMVVLTLSSATAWDARLLDGFYWFLLYFVFAAFLASLVSREHAVA